MQRQQPLMLILKTNKLKYPIGQSETSNFILMHFQKDLSNPLQPTLIFTFFMYSMNAVQKTIH